MIEPKILKGTRDHGPLTMEKRHHVTSVIRQVFERYGYVTIETPVIEYAETILGKYGEEGDKLTYKFEDNGGRQIALRYDQTVPFARYYASNWQELPSPFKRYQISRVWRADKPQRGRLREFYQCDIDIIGTTSLMAELEMIQVMAKVFEELGFEDYEIQFNDRKVMNAMLSGLGVATDDRLGVIRALDKFDKIGREGVSGELDKLGLNVNMRDQLLEIVTTEGSNENKLAAVSNYEADDVKKILKMAETAGLDMSHIVYNPALARGLDYYTGLIFEVVLRNDRAIGSVCAGGRYDNLTAMFCKENFSGVGVAFGFERLVEVLEERKLLEEIQLSTEVLVVQFEETLNQNLKLAAMLREDEINTELYFEPAKLGKQFKYADKKNIPLVVIQGEKEAAENMATLKDMRSGEQYELSLEALSNKIMEFLN